MPPMDSIFSWGVCFLVPPNISIKTEIGKLLSSLHFLGVTFFGDGMWISMMIGSISVEFATPEKSTVVVLKRHLAPRTVGLLERTLFRGSLRVRAVVRPSSKEEVSFPLRVGRVGLEKAIRDLSSGMVTYWPQGSSLAVQLVSRETRFPVNHLGSVTNEQLEFFNQLRVGTAVMLSLKASDQLDEAEDDL
ncbi:MAG: hypothetical protein ACFFB3_02920 [Candidatus Hodarchaeota archaeon]